MKIYLFPCPSCGVVQGCDCLPLRLPRIDKLCRECLNQFSRRSLA